MSILDDADAFWGRSVGRHAPPNVMLLALLDKFLRRLEIVDEAAFQAVAERPCLYLANHQVFIESLLFVLAVSTRTRRSVFALAKSVHRERWLGRLTELFYAYPGNPHPHHVLYVNRDDPDEVRGFAALLETRLELDGGSLLVHVEGTRRRSCRRGRVQHMSPMWVEMAVRHGWPIVPVRFVGGLPVEDLGVKYEVPFGMGSQVIRIGRPILPRALAVLAESERMPFVRACINELTDGEREQPEPADTPFQAAVEAWQAHSGADPMAAVVLAALLRYRPELALDESRTSAEPLTDALAAAARLSLSQRWTAALVLPDTPEGRWMGEMGRYLLGPRGPEIVLDSEAVAVGGKQ